MFSIGDVVKHKQSGQVATVTRVGKRQFAINNAPKLTEYVSHWALTSNTTHHNDSRPFPAVASTGVNISMSPVETSTSIPRTTQRRRIHISYNFENDTKAQHLMSHLNIESNVSTSPISRLTPSSELLTPEILLGYLENDSFVERMVQTLISIYTQKLAIYNRLHAELTLTVTNDREKRQDLRYDGIGPEDIDKMFPMTITNIMLLRAVEALCHRARTVRNDITVRQVRKNVSLSITNPEFGITSITGESRRFIRAYLCRVLFMLSKGHQPFMDSFLNIALTGPAGVGKTKLANSIAYVYKQSGILLNGDITILSPADFIGQFVGKTAQKTKGVLLKGLEGVTLIDEAYQLMPCHNGELQPTNSFGPEAITEIVNFLDKYKGLSLVIVAGYTKDITNCFFNANSGLPRRFPVRLELPPYSISDLLNIFINETHRRIGKQIFDRTLAQILYSVMYRVSTTVQNAFEYQAGDMMNLSTIFLEQYYGNHMLDWNSSRQAKQSILMNTVNTYFQSKGLQLHLA